MHTGEWTAVHTGEWQTEPALEHFPPTVPPPKSDVGDEDIIT
ncbi:MAG: hypothetical protein ACRD2W_10805 [Acidimicrobiales bacterium]